MSQPWWSDLPRDCFGDTPELMDDLLALVLSGAKTATCSSAEGFAQLPFTPAPGVRTVIVDSQQRPACVIETIRITDETFDTISPALTDLEGEGDHADWRAGHKAFFRREGTFDPEMKLKFEIFRMIEIIPRNAG